ncbi:MAG: hypothetical protein M1812_005740 [Candelaria pacifica]|nr:MAG: hypothetical protein M1812_005740 [Candelaria pacifica]
MHFHIPSLLESLCTLAFFLSTSATPIPNEDLEARQLPVGYDCTNRDQTLVMACWDVVNTTQYLFAWANQNKDCIPAPAGVQGTDAAGYDAQGSFWDCFTQRIKPVEADVTADGIFNQHCATIGPNNCYINGNISVYSVQDQFILLSIQAVAQWFNSIHDAIGNSQTSVTAQIGEIVTLWNPPTDKNKLTSQLFVALGAAIGSIAFPGGGKILARYAFTPALQQFPGVFKYLYPYGTVDSTVAQGNELSQQLDWLVTTTQTNMVAALGQALNSWDVFTTITQAGAFIGPPSSSNDQQKNLTITLNTFAVSQVMQANNVYLTVALYTNPKEWVANGTLKKQEYINCPDYDQYGMCDQWWYDSVEGNAYGVVRDDKNQKHYTDELHQVFSRWTTPELLFRAAKKCADYVYAGGDPNALLDPNAVEPRCISNLPLCVWNQQCWGEWCLLGNDYPAYNCLDKNKGFKSYECGDISQDDTRWVPNPYLGPILEQSGVIVCNGKHPAKDGDDN